MASDYSKLVKALRYCVNARNCEKCGYRINNNSVKCRMQRVEDAAAAIDELQAQLLKLGEWYTELYDGDKKYQCSNCLTHWDVETRYCPFCGAKMEVQDGQK